MFPYPSSPRFLRSALLAKQVLPLAKVVALGLCVTALALPSSAQLGGRRHAPAPLTVVVPPSSKIQAGDLGQRAHTNIRFLSGTNVSPDEAPPFAGYAYETPASLACVYRLVTPTRGCNPNSTTTNASGGSQTIAIVDAYDDPNAAADLAFFSSQFGLPEPKFKVVYASGAEPAEDPTGGWEIEESLDIEYAHAMAPNATIYLVEAASSYYSDLLPAVQVAGNLIACGKTTACPKWSKGKGEISMSWGGSEFPQETSLDGFFTTPNVVYVAAAGDSPGTIYPCVSPNIVCAGGTTDSRSLETGDLIAQIAWSDAGGGASLYEPIPSWQASNRFIARQLNGSRGAPDMAADSNPITGVWVWDTFPVEGYEPGWYIVGGTSAATPIIAGVINSAGNFASSSAAELSRLYVSNGLGTPGFTDIVYGACNYYSASYSQFGWDLCTGLGAPNHLK